MNLRAPDYPPAAAFHRPTPVPFVFGIDTMAISELLASPAMREVLVKHAPAVLALAHYEMFRPYLSDFTLRDVALYFPGDCTAMLGAVETALRSLPRSEWPPHAR